MGIGDVLKPATSMFSGVLGKLAAYWWVLFVGVGVAIVIAVIFLIRMNKQRKSQWTHTLEVKRVMKGGILSDPIEHKMRRFPLVKDAEVFELEKPLLGSYLIPEPGKYSGLNRYSIILDSDNRIWRNEGEYFDPVEGSVNVSARHAEIDLQVSTLKSDWQNINKVQKRIDWMQLAKYALSAILIIAVMIVAIVAIGRWGDAQKQKVESDKAFAALGESMKDAMDSVLSSKNTDLLILDKLNELYKTKNIAGTIKTIKNETV